MIEFLTTYGLSPTAFFLLLVVLVLCAMRTYTTRGRSRSFLVLATLALIAAVPAYQGIPIAFTNAGLKQLPVGASLFPVLRLGFYSPGDVSPMWYAPSSVACPLAAGAGDNGSQVQSGDNKCWKAPYPTNGWDVNEFGAVSSANETTGTISLSTPTIVTLASASDFLNGEGIYIFGAGAAGAPLQATIVSGAGTTTLTITPAASTAVTAARTEHDDGPAIQAALNAASASATLGGTAFLEPGYYYAPAGLTCPLNTIFAGANQNASFVVAGGGNSAALFTANANGCFVRDMTFSGKGVTGNAAEPFGASFPAVLVGANTTWERVLVQGGTGIKCTGGESNWTQVSVPITYGDGFLAQGCSGWIRHSSFDQTTGTGVFPGNNLTINAWAALTVYSTLNTLVTNGGYYMQLSTAGTSGGSAPSNANVGFLIVDGTARWKIVCAVPSTASVGGFAQQIDSGTTEIYEEQVDMTGLMGYSLGFTNTLGTTNAVIFRADQDIPSQSIFASGIITSGSVVILNDILGGDVVSTSWPIVQTTNAFTGQLIVANSNLNTADFGVQLNNTNGTADIHDNTISSRVNPFNTSTGIVGGYFFHDNHLTSTTGYGVSIGATNNNYNIHDNHCVSCASGTLNDSSEGANAPTTSNN